MQRDNEAPGGEDDEDGDRGASHDQLINFNAELQERVLPTLQFNYFQFQRQEEAAVTFLAVGSGQSRLGSEFSYISDLGKGGFGEVMKVKNNLDGQG